MVANISSAAQSISKGLTRLQTPETPEEKGQTLSSDAGNTESKQEGSATVGANNSSVGARLSSALGRLSGSDKDNIDEPSKFENANKSVDVQISPQARRLMAMSDKN
jgi:hypothetical protein